MNNTKESDRTEFKKLTSEKKTTKKYFVLALILVVILICLYPVIVLLFMLWVCPDIIWNTYKRAERPACKIIVPWPKINQL